MSPVSAALIIAGRYRLDHQVAVDQAGEVWQGTDLELARPVAIKLLSGDAGAGARMQFRTAARRAGSLSHEGLVRVFDYCEPDVPESAESAFMVMEYVHGQTLADRLRAGPLEAARAHDVVAQLTAALRAVHQAGLVHGDLRPEKILLSAGGAVKLFGFSGTCPGGPGQVDADLRALDLVARDCLTDCTSPDEVGPLPSTLTLALVQDPAAEPVPSFTGQLPAKPAAHKPARGVRRAAVRALAVIAVALAAVALFGVLKPNGGDPAVGRANAAAPVRVTTARLIGRPVDVVRQRLKKLGLIVRTRWHPSARVSAGDVIAVRPAGLVPAHSVVVIIGSSGRSGAGPAPERTRVRRARQNRHGPHGTASHPPAPVPSPSPSGSPTPSPSPTSPPSPSNSPSPPSGSPPPPGIPSPSDSTAG